MAETLTIQVPDELYAQLRTESIREGKTPEVVAAAYLERLMPRGQDEGLLRWIGAIRSDVPDAAEKHDEYLGRALHDELGGDAGS